MSAFYDQASLVVVPSGYKSGKIYAQKPLTTDGQLTFSRASTATRVNASGALETVNSNVPRLDYTNSSCPKLLLEPQRTNLVRYSEQFDNAAWTKADSTITVNATTSPDGTQNADKIVENTVNDAHAVLQSVSLAAGTYSYSFFAKASGRSLINVQRNDSSISPSFSHNYNLANGTATGGGIIEAYANGFYRCSGSFTVPSTAVTGVGIYLSNGSSLVYAGDGVSGVFVYGFQYELGAYATSYVKTEASAVTRLADACYKTGISSLIGQTEGVFFFDYVASAKNIDASNYAVLFIVGTSLDNFQIYNGGTSLNWYARSSAGIALDKSAGQTLVAGQRYKIAFAYKAGSYALYINGVQKSTDTSAIVPAASQFNLNATGLGASPATVENKFNQVLFFPTRLTNAQLAELTTL